VQKKSSITQTKCAKKQLKIKLMKTIKLFTLASFLLLSQNIFSQTAEEIISNYFENTGGYENWGNLEGIKMVANINQQGMEIPMEIYQMKDGKQMTIINFQGKEIKQGVFDGEHLWSHNFMTMEAEESDAETTANFKLDINDFPDSFYDYATKGYTVELMGTEDYQGTETFKIKLVKEPKANEGVEEEDVSFYYFDTESFVPIAMENEIKSGPGKGMVMEISFSDYEEVEGLYFPFSLTQGVKGQPGQPITMSEIILNHARNMSFINKGF